MTRAILFLMMLTLSAPALADPPVATLSSAPAAATTSSVDVLGILIGMLKQAQMDLRQSKMLAGQMKQLQIAGRAQNLGNGNSGSDSNRREQEEKLRALMAQLDETERELSKMEQFIARNRAKPMGVSRMPSASVRPATTLAPATLATPRTGLPRGGKKPGALAPATIAAPPAATTP